MNTVKVEFVRRTLLFKPKDLVVAIFVLVALAILINPALIPASVVTWGAAVTVVARTQRINVAGARWMYQWKVTGADTNTLDTGIPSGKRVIPFMEPCTVTAIAQSTVNAHIRFTFSASGAFTSVGLIAQVG